MAGAVYTSWLLPDDGIIDPVAVEIAARGTRRVRLTARERRAAAALIVARGGTRIRLLAHRVSFKLATGKDPGQLVIRHLCDTPPCCTPDCFLPGTQADNVRDAIIRRRLNVDGLSVFRAIRIAQVVARTGAGSKLCTWCGQVKDLANFETALGAPDGRAYWCRACAAGHQFMPSQVPASARLCLVTGKPPRPAGRGPLAADPRAALPPAADVLGAAS